jgi:hypothetical protein
MAPLSSSVLVVLSAILLLSCKARNRVGVEVAIEALREAWRDRHFTVADLDRAARACRVERVIRPYVEGVLA